MTRSLLIRRHIYVVHLTKQLPKFSSSASIPLSPSAAPREASLSPLQHSNIFKRVFQDFDTDGRSNTRSVGPLRAPLTDGGAIAPRQASPPLHCVAPCLVRQCSAALGYMGWSWVAGTVVKNGGVMGQIYTNLIAMVHPKCRSSCHVVWVRVHWSHNFAAHTTVLPTKTILIIQWLHSIAGKTAVSLAKLYGQ